jgi:GR25 family glycosyltransferase involved in LPS biosynthesis
MKVYVTHYTKLRDRKEFILNQFEDENITDFEFIEDYDQEVLTGEHFSMFTREVKPSQISLTIKHLHAWRDILKNHEMALIFEDDVMLDKDFTSELNKFMEQLPPTFDFFFIGNGSNLHMESDKIVPGKYVYWKCVEQTDWGGFGATRATDSYVISKKGAEKLCKYVDSLTGLIPKPLDHWLNDVFRDINAEVYWSEPNIIVPGSSFGMFPSMI